MSSVPGCSPSSGCQADRIEASAATAAFKGALGTGSIGLGSVKANIGHLVAAAGVAGVIKTVLMLEHATIAPAAGAGRPHPELALHDSPFHVVTEAEPWPKPEHGPRRAGVSSVGIGGTNVHVVLEQAPPRPRDTPPSGPQVLLLSARTEDALKATAGRLATALRAPGAPTLADTAHTLRFGRTPSPSAPTSWLPTARRPRPASPNSPRVVPCRPRPARTTFGRSGRRGCGRSRCRGRPGAARSSPAGASSPSEWSRAKAFRRPRGCQRPHWCRVPSDCERAKNLSVFAVFAVR